MTRRKHKPRPDKGEVLDKGTPEVRKKLKASVTRRLWKQGRITDQEYHWVMDIEDVAETLSSVVCPLGSEGSGGGRGYKMPRIVGHLSDMQRVRATKFALWQEEIKKKFSDRELAAVMEIIVDNLGINEAERQYGLGQRNGVKTFRKIIALWG